MPRGSPFTSLCRQFAGLSEPRRVDLHAHTTASDGAFTPSQLVAFARQARLKALAITDHDTLAGLEEATRTATEFPGPPLEIVPGIEITTTFRDRDLHLLGYFIRVDHPELNEALVRTLNRRRERFRGFIAALAARGTIIPEAHIRSVETASTSLGRRHLSELLVRCGLARTRHEAWQRFIAPLGEEHSTKSWLPTEEAIALVHHAGGVSSLAHPPREFTEFEALRDEGLNAIEAVYPWGRSSCESRLRETAVRLGLLVTGGSDCHGPEPAHRRVGSHAISSEELERLRQFSGRFPSFATV